MFFTKARRKTRPYFTQVWQKPLVMVLLTLTLSIYSARLNGILCSACAYSTQKYQMCWCEQQQQKNLAASLACKSMRKWSFSVHLLAILPQQFWSEPTFFLQRIRKWLCETNTCFDFFLGCREGIIPPWFHTVGLCIFLLLICSKSIWLFMCGCWEMINGAVAPNKYEIPGSLTGLDWREKCIISPWMHRSQRGINIILSETQTYLERQLEEGEKRGEGAV